MTPEQEQVYFHWKRLGWCTLNRGALAVVVFQDRENEQAFSVWTQDRAGILVEYFFGLDEVRQELKKIGVYEMYPDFAV